MATTTIKTIKPGGGGDYTSLANWQNARKADLVATDRIEIAECYGGGNCGAFTLQSGAGQWTTDATHYIVIRAASGEKHPGYYDSAKARIGDGTGFESCAFYIPNVYIQDMQINNLVHAAGATAISISSMAAGGSCYIDRCIFKGGGWDINIADADASLYFRNCAFHGAAKDVLTMTAGAVYFYNCTGWSTEECLKLAGAGATCTENNNYWRLVTAGKLIYTVVAGTMNKGNETATSDNEAVTAALDNIAYSTDNFTNVTAGSENFHLAAASALLLKAADLSASFTDDIDNGTRPAGRWDIGCDQVSEALKAGALFVLGV